jgi:hypothetical protein
MSAHPAFLSFEDPTRIVSFTELHGKAAPLVRTEYLGLRPAADLTGALGAAIASAQPLLQRPLALKKYEALHSTAGGTALAVGRFYGCDRSSAGSAGGTRWSGGTGRAAKDASASPA